MGMFAALHQRIATRFTIKPMDLAESAAYLRHHLTLREAARVRHLVPTPWPLIHVDTWPRFG
jgi:type II secretory pathway predicted ATPase ExeA